MVGQFLNALHMAPWVMQTLATSFLLPLAHVCQLLEKSSLRHECMPRAPCASGPGSASWPERIQPCLPSYAVDDRDAGDSHGLTRLTPGLLQATVLRVAVIAAATALVVSLQRVNRPLPSPVCLLEKSLANLLLDVSFAVLVASFLAMTMYQVTGGTLVPTPVTSVAAA